MKRLLLIIIFFSPFFLLGQSKGMPDSLEGTRWINSHFEGCTDTLWVTSKSDMIFYSCEHGYNTEANYTVKGETIIVDLFDYGHDNETIELTSKYRMVIREDEIHFLYIAHKYASDFKEIDEKFYQTAGYYKKLN